MRGNYNETFGVFTWQAVSDRRFPWVCLNHGLPLWHRIKTSKTHSVCCECVGIQPTDDLVLGLKKELNYNRNFGRNILTLVYCGCKLTRNMYPKGTICLQSMKLQQTIIFRMEKQFIKKTLYYITYDCVWGSLA